MNNVFEILVQELSKDERAALLEQIRNSSYKSPEPYIHADLEDGSEKSSAEQFAEAGFFTRLFYYIVALFTGKTPVEAYQNHLIQNAARLIESEVPQCYDFANGFLKKGFLSAFKSLRQASKIMYEEIAVSIGKDRGGFYALLCKLQLPQVWERFETEVNIARIGDAYGNLSDKDFRNIAETALEELFDSLTAEEKFILSRDAAAYLFINYLGLFAYDKVLSCFTRDEEEKAPVSSVKPFLIELGAIFSMIRTSPSPEFFEAGILFSLREGNLHGSAFDEELIQRMNRCNAALETIDKFLEQTRFEKLLGILLRRPGGDIPPKSGAEDWFSHYKRFWRARLDTKLRRFLTERELSKAMTRAAMILGVRSIPPLEHYAVGNYAVPLKYPITLAFLDAFARSIYASKFHRPLNILFIDADFYKAENRDEYAHAFSVMETLLSQCEIIDRKLAVDGELGSLIASIASEDLNPHQKLRKTERYIEALDREVEVLIATVVPAFNSLYEVLNGILYGEVGGVYDSLSNIGYIGGRNNQSYLLELKEVLLVLQDMKSFVEELVDLETRIYSYFSIDHDD